jgi:hypothetical protein
VTLQLHITAYFNDNVRPTTSEESKISRLQEPLPLAVAIAAAKAIPEKEAPFPP